MISKIVYNIPEKYYRNGREAGKNISLGGPKRGSGFQSGTELKATFPKSTVQKLQSKNY